MTISSNIGHLTATVIPPVSASQSKENALFPECNCLHLYRYLHAINARCEFRSHSPVDSEEIYAYAINAICLSSLWTLSAMVYACIRCEKLTFGLDCQLSMEDIRPLRPRPGRAETDSPGSYGPVRPRSHLAIKDSLRTSGRRRSKKCAPAAAPDTPSCGVRRP